MLTVTEITRNILNAKRDQIKNKLLQEFYEHILYSALSYQRTEGELNISFDEIENLQLAEIALNELVSDNFDFQRYVDDAYVDKENYDITIVYNLENPYKSLDSQATVW